MFLIILILTMGVSIEQWRCANASAASLMRVTKKEEKHDGMLWKMRDDRLT